MDDTKLPPPTDEQGQTQQGSTDGSRPQQAGLGQGAWDAEPPPQPSGVVPPPPYGSYGGGQPPQPPQPE